MMERLLNLTVLVRGSLKKKKSMLTYLVYLYCFIGLCFIALCKCCIFYKLKTFHQHKDHNSLYCYTHTQCDGLEPNPWYLWDMPALEKREHNLSWSRADLQITWFCSRSFCYKVDEGKSETKQRASWALAHTTGEAKHWVTLLFPEGEEPQAQQGVSSGSEACCFGEGWCR